MFLLNINPFTVYLHVKSNMYEMHSSFKVFEIAMRY